MFFLCQPIPRSTARGPFAGTTRVFRRGHTQGKPQVHPDRPPDPADSDGSLPTPVAAQGRAADGCQSTRWDSTHSYFHQRTHHRRFYGA